MVLTIDGLPSEKWYEIFIQPSESDSNEHSDINEPPDSTDYLSRKYCWRKNLPKTRRKSYPQPRPKSDDQEEVYRYIKNAFFDKDLYDENRIEETEQYLKESWKQYERCLAASTIQKYWLECRYNPGYKMCQKVLFRNLDIISTQRTKFKKNTN